MQSWLVFAVSTLFSAILGLCEQTVDSPHIYRIVASECSNGIQEMSQTGFRITELAGIVTALHGVAHCDSIRATPGDGVADAKSLALKLEQVDIVRDMALLSPYPNEADDPATGGLQPVTGLLENELENLCVIGHPLGIRAQLTSHQINARPNARKTLLELIPANQKLSSALQERNSPGLEVQILSLEAALTQGHSGAPIVNQHDQVVGVANGGLAGEGATTISWAIPWQDIEWQPVEQQWEALENLKGKNPKLVFAYPWDKSDWCTYALNIYDAKTQQHVEAASLQLLIGTNPYTGLTNSNGYARFELPCTNDGAVATLDITARNYEVYQATVTLSEDIVTKILLQPQDLVAKHKPLLETVIHHSDDIERRANLTLDTSLLPSVFHGEALKRLVDAINTLKKKGFYLVTEQTNLRFEDFWISNDEQLARVSFIQTSKLTMKEVETHTCSGQAPLQEIPQTIYLERVGDKWMVYKIDFEAEATIQKGCS